MNTLLINKSNKASSVAFENDMMRIELEDGRILLVPLEWFPKLRNASVSQLEKWRFIGEGEGIHWEELDEDILVENLIN
ncbi:DUF2442 domain-containing protein [Chryseobacterium salipaludis]|uniref:DUF2442 domain-containing protein n=1 Tax=Chryseobacterium TaxID=59732 RepID=UPI001FF30E4E|nr:MULTISPECIES: DUF2442 domain-containing protein [Chryseobacterium]MCJ8497376.1 DUF2442 domain-containing protein [Chryseobacterium salipaludis]MCX3295783.1 DUF2442 domain-containing protein [Planobacterium sp. JC490]